MTNTNELKQEPRSGLSDLTVGLENRTTVDSGALRMALNVLRRSGKGEVADELENTAVRVL